MPKKQKPKFELLKDAYAIIDGLPDENVDLKTWRAKDEGPTCGSIACAAGWLTLHPQFQALGLATEGKSHNMHANWPSYKGSIRLDALGKLFGIEWCGAHDLFSVRGYGEAVGLGLPESASDKQIFLARVRKFLEEHGQLKEQLAEVQHAS